jgi:hypothetical protein
LLNNEVMVIPFETSVFFWEISPGVSATTSGTDSSEAFDFFVVTFHFDDPDFNTFGLPTDGSPTLTYDPSTAPLTVDGGADGYFGATAPYFDDLDGDSIPVDYDLSTPGDPARLLLFHHFNTEGNRTQIVTIEGPVPAPTNLTATAISDSQIDLEWDDNSSNEEGFIIERSDDGGGSWTQIHDTAAPNVTTYSDTGLDAGTTYWYRVYAYNTTDGTVSSYSNVASATTLNFLDCGLIVNCDMETDSEPNGIPEPWIEKSTRPNDMLSAGTGYLGSQSYQFSGNGSGTRKLVQDVTGLTGLATDTLQLTARVDRETGALASNAKVQIKITIYNNDGSKQKLTITVPDGTDFSDLVDSLPINVNKNYNKIRVELMVKTSSGAVYFDNISLVVTP